MQEHEAIGDSSKNMFDLCNIKRSGPAKAIEGIGKIL